MLSIHCTISEMKKIPRFKFEHEMTLILYCYVLVWEDAASFSMDHSVFFTIVEYKHGRIQDFFTRLGVGGGPKDHWSPIFPKFFEKEKKLYVKLTTWER